MCEGPIVAPAGKKAVKKQNFLKESFKKFWDKITGREFDILLNRYLVNTCPKCGDLEINNEWKRIPYPYTTSIKNAVMFGGIAVNGCFKICNFCVTTEKEKEKQQIYSASGQVSSASF